MAIESIPGGGTIITGEHIELYRMLALKGALSLEMKGLRRSRGASAHAVIKHEFGLTGSKRKVYDEFCKLIETRFPKPEVDDGTRQ